MLSNNIAYTSFPKLLGECFLKERQTIVVSGTHGKTTTTSAMAKILEDTGQNPGFLIGGIPHDFSRSFRVGKGFPFVIEGDEYDTAFFDKHSKFHHYEPKFLIVNNLEFDHADIFNSIDDIYREFETLLGRLDDPRHIIANVDNPGVATLLHRAKVLDRVTTVAAEGKDSSAHFCLSSIATEKAEPGQVYWLAEVKGSSRFGKISIRTKLSGLHNLSNFAMIIACLDRMLEAKVLQKEFGKPELEAAITNFNGVKRRMESLGTVNGIDVYEDFAHHPTAVATVIDGFKKGHPERRLVVAFEPRSASQRRNVFSDAFAKSLSQADRVLIGECPLDTRIPEHERMDTAKLEQAVGSHATAFPTNAALLESLVDQALPGDAIVFMSSGSFSGIQYRVVGALKEKASR